MLQFCKATLRRAWNSSNPVFAFTIFLAFGFALRTLAVQNTALQHLSERGKQIATAFQKFSPMVKTRSDEKWFYVESNGMPEHKMMVGITNWQQQVPLPQSYTGRNAWQFPLKPVPATNPLSSKDHFFRGAMVIATNGVPIFNALNNRGEDSYLIGELDEFGGHCGRADDYHYHISPTHLTKTVGKDKPIGYALDGYPLYGLTEADGSPVAKLDEFNGHATATLGYHYHASKTYPYLNGGFHGEVTEIEGQVDPQPRSQPVRPDTPPLRGAKITGFEQPKSGSFALTYVINGLTCKINYAVQPDGSCKFEYINAKGTVFPRTYPAPRNGGRRNAPPNNENAPPATGTETSNSNPPAEIPSVEGAPKKAFDSAKTLKGFVFSSPVVGTNKVLPIEFTGDGSGISPPLAWSGAPAGTKSYAVIMHHIDPQGVIKWYWTLYNIPASTKILPKNVQDIGIAGNNSVNSQLGYAPPHSKGPGAKTYVITLYALSEAPEIAVDPQRVNREVLLAAMKGHILAKAEMKVVYTRAVPE